MAQIYSFEDKLKAVLQCKEGYTPWMVEEETGIDHHTIQDWINRYNQLGEAGLQRKVYNRITFEEKCAIIRKYQKKVVPLHVICAQYNVSRANVKRWIVSGKYVPDPGPHERATLVIKPKRARMGRPKKLKTESDLLRERVAYLEAENALLKKVKALVAEREHHRIKNGLPPSKH